jgi:hypothetical protein
VRRLSDQQTECVRQRTKIGRGQFYKALELFEILKVESVFGGLYSPGARRPTKPASAR